MTEGKLTQLNELSSKIEGKKAVLKKIDTLSVRGDIVIADSSIILVNSHDWRVAVPEELNNVFFKLLRDFYKKQLDALEKEFEEM